MLFVRRWCCVLLLAAVPACRRDKPAPIQRIAILPLENLSGDASADWIGPAAASLAATAATGGGRMHPFAAATRAEALRARATRIVQGYYVVRQGVVSLRAVDEVVSTATNRPLAAETPLKTGVLPLVETLARGIGANVRALAPVNTEALRLYGLALLAAEPAARAERLEQALKLDPALTLARLELADALTARGDRPAAQKALSESPGVAGILLHRVAMRRAELAADIDAWIAAARSALDFHPFDADHARRLADTLQRRRRFPEAIAAYRRAIEADPELTQVWNDRAYAEAFGGDLAAAQQSLERYAAFSPNSPNPKDSLGEVLFHHGRFSEAEAAFLESHAKDPSFLAGGGLVKAAFAAWLAGSLERADGHMNRYVAQGKGSPAALQAMAQWRYLTGRKKDAGPASPAQLAVWALAESDRARAREVARAALPQPAAAICLFVTGSPATAAEWKARAEKLSPSPAVRRLALALALLVNGHAREAVAPARELLDDAPPGQDALPRWMLAWALAEAGAAKEAQELLRRWPLPPAGAFDVYYALVFPRVRAIMGKP